MAKSVAKRNPREFGRCFVNVIQWLGLGLILTFLLWTFAMVFSQALEQLCRK
jgi:hypothetical protein